MTRWILLVACVLVVLRSAWIAFTLDHARLTEWGWGYLTAQIILFLVALGGALLLVRGWLRKAER